MARPPAPKFDKWVCPQCGHEDEQPKGVLELYHRIVGGKMHKMKRRVSASG